MEGHQEKEARTPKLSPLTAAGLASFCYFDWGKFRGHITDMGFMGVEKIHTPLGLDAYVIMGREMTICCVRGSDEWADWVKTNIDIRTIEIRGLKLHRGFALRAIDLMTELERREVSPTHFVGHSMGGAVISALNALYPNLCSQGAVFGSPGVLRLFSKHPPPPMGIKRYVLWNDPVPRFPLTFVGHVPTYVIGNEGIYPLNRFNPAYWTQLFKIFRSWRTVMDTHAADNYFHRIDYTD